MHEVQSYHVYTFKSRHLPYFLRQSFSPLPPWLLQQPSLVWILSIASAITSLRWTKLPGFTDLCQSRLIRKADVARITAVKLLLGQKCLLQATDGFPWSHVAMKRNQMGQVASEGKILQTRIMRDVIYRTTCFASRTGVIFLEHGRSPGRKLITPERYPAGGPKVPFKHAQAITLRRNTMRYCMKLPSGSDGQPCLRRPLAIAPSCSCSNAQTDCEDESIKASSLWQIRTFLALCRESYGF